ncbi:hypothetical protein GCM10009837_06800 [Streptomyces durmitorensis]|uniref:Uncharacterized protein n=1 Tax=Streptomyces durmitorensis TaxID=319947 RepID=A0ABY4PM97_9ACTN|nr:hypothetical protein [Streptomyces durmitorensis]UQT54424.1 hypothetical protein M4V62_04580 [Streptomyces durmitorensis]
MTTADHIPSRACYLRGCRSDGCERENYRYKKQLSLEYNQGRRRLRDATQTRVHIERLMLANWTQVQIGQASGVASASIHKIYTGAQTSIANWRAAAILAIHIGPPPPDRKHVEAAGSRRRLQALRVLGHSRTRLALELGCSPDRIKAITNGIVTRVRAEEATEIKRVYRQLATVAGKKQVASVAHTRGWYGPLAWDDIDDPACEPESGWCSEAKAGAKRKVYADPARVAELTAQRKSASEIALQLGCHQRTVVRIRGRVAKAVAA